jgi:hypothetical protein
MALFRRLIGAIYLIAFSSIYVQYPGLIGYNGLLPVNDFISNTVPQFPPSSSLLEKIFRFPSIIQFAREISVDESLLGEFLCLIGVVCSLFATLGFDSSLLFALNWMAYLSIFLVGQSFLSFQWDILLLETGFLVLVNLALQRHGQFMNWLYRFLIFKLMFMAGVVKLQSNCPTWNQFTALEVYNLILFDLSININTKSTTSPLSVSRMVSRGMPIRSIPSSCDLV